MSDDTDGLELTRRRALGSLGALGVAAAGAGAGTMAYFRDTETSNNNTVQAGTMALDIHNGQSLQWAVNQASPGGPESETQDIIFENTGSVSADHLELDFQNTEFEDNNGDPTDDQTGNWSFNPGPESDPKTGTDSGENTPDPGASGMAKYVLVQYMHYDSDTTSDDASTEFTLINGGQPQDVSGHDLSVVDDSISEMSLYDLAHSNNEDALDDFAPPEKGSVAGTGGDGSYDTKLQVKVRLHADTPNKYQGDTVVTTLTASLHQDSSQDN